MIDASIENRADPAKAPRVRQQTMTEPDASPDLLCDGCGQQPAAYPIEVAGDWHRLCPKCYRLAVAAEADRRAEQRAAA